MSQSEMDLFLQPQLLGDHFVQIYPAARTICASVRGKMTTGVSAAQILFSVAAYLILKPIKVLAGKGSCKECGWVLENRILGKGAVWRCLDCKLFIAITSPLCLLTPVLGQCLRTHIHQAGDSLAVTKNLNSHLNSHLKLKMTAIIFVTQILGSVNPVFSPFPMPQRGLEGLEYNMQ